MTFTNTYKIAQIYAAENIFNKFDCNTSQSITNPMFDYSSINIYDAAKNSLLYNEINANLFSQEITQNHIDQKLFSSPFGTDIKLDSRNLFKQFGTLTFNNTTNLQNSIGGLNIDYSQLFKAPEFNFTPIASANSSTATSDEASGVNGVKAADNTNFNSKVFSASELANAQKLYEEIGLKEKGLSLQVFARAIQGYNNLSDQGNGYLGILDTTQGHNDQRYYLIDLKNKKFIGQSAIRLGSGKQGKMDDCVRANTPGSGETLTGFEKIKGEYISPRKKWRIGIRLDGLETGINNNALKKAAVAHYTTGNSSLGCKAITPIYKNGKVDTEATYAKLRKLFPQGGIIFTYPKDERYWSKSKLYS